MLFGDDNVIDDDAYERRRRRKRRNKKLLRGTGFGAFVIGATSAGALGLSAIFSYNSKINSIEADACAEFFNSEAGQQYIEQKTLNDRAIYEIDPRKILTNKTSVPVAAEIDHESLWNVISFMYKALNDINDVRTVSCDIDTRAPL